MDDSLAKYEYINEAFEKRANTERAAGMEKYMLNQFEFYGIQSVERKGIYKEFLKAEKKAGCPDWEFLDHCYEDEHREFQYLACDYLRALAPKLAAQDLAKVREYILTKSWWDTVDSLCKVAGTISKSYPEVDELMLNWACDDSIWVRRAAIEYQLGLKGETRAENLAKIILLNTGSDEFFINKAIGWALRDYSKTDPEWVAGFIDENRGELSALSIREGSKYI
ncbi:MAG: DNA alkylation repair protein [Eubacteriales bacterium]|nr:DNA alkylation repair protein [Eubacteriales bacterium]